jgi:hypothetical protein
MSAFNKVKVSVFQMNYTTGTSGSLSDQVLNQLKSGVDENQLLLFKEFFDVMDESFNRLNLKSEEFKQTPNSKLRINVKKTTAGELLISRLIPSAAANKTVWENLNGRVQRLQGGDLRAEFNRIAKGGNFTIPSNLSKKEKPNMNKFVQDFIAENSKPPKKQTIFLIFK